MELRFFRRKIEISVRKIRGANGAKNESILATLGNGIPVWIALSRAWGILKRGCSQCRLSRDRKSKSRCLTGRRKFCPAFSWLWDFQRAADFPGQQVGDFSVARDGFAATGGVISLDRLGAAFALERSTVGFEGADQFPALHEGARGINFSPLPRRARASLRRSSSSNRIDSRSDSNASSSVSPWPLPSGNSGEKAMNHSPSRTMRAVKVAAVFVAVRSSKHRLPSPMIDHSP